MSRRRIEIRGWGWIPYFHLKQVFKISCFIVVVLSYVILLSEWLVAFLLQQCRQAKISYTGKFTADVCFQYDSGPIIRENVHFGQFPIMLKVGLFVSVCVIAFFWKVFESIEIFFFVVLFSNEYVIYFCFYYCIYIRGHDICIGE